MQAKVTQPPSAQRARRPTVSALDSVQFPEFTATVRTGEQGAPTLPCRSAAWQSEKSSSSSEVCVCVMSRV